jgi:NADPH:quinone reductase-like Zn-dependent oxidoreductase
MKGVVLTGHGGLDKLEGREDLPRPEPAQGEVLIRLGGAAVNNTDINTRLAWYSKGNGDAADATWTGEPLTFPFIQGADGCGHVVEVGRGVDTGLIGKRVLIEPCLREVAGKPIEPFWYVGSEVPGTFAEFVTVAARHAHVIDSPLSDVEIASFACSYSTAENMIVRTGATSGERAIVTGASGGVGSAAVQLLRAREVEVTAVTSPSKADALISLGAVRCLNRDETPEAKSFDIAFDLAGGPGWPGLINALKSGGRYAVSGAVAGAEVPLDLRDLYLKDLSFFGCTRLGDGVFAGLVRWIESGKIKPLVAEVFDLKDIRAAQSAFLERSHIGKIGLKIGDS